MPRSSRRILWSVIRQRSSRGGYSDNPTVQSFGYNDLTIAAQRSIAPVVRGNVMGRHEGESSKWVVVSEEPLPKRKRKSSQKNTGKKLVHVSMCYARILSVCILYVPQNLSTMNCE